MARATRTPLEEAVDTSFKGATFAVFVEAVRRRNPNAAANAVLVFGAMFLPRLTERLYGVELRPWQRVYTESAMLAHAVGMLGLYDDTWWWDHLTHALSATVLGGVAHVVADRRGRGHGRCVLASVAVGGVLWEGMEYAIHRLSDRLGVEPVLIYYGREDTLGDLLFDLVGAVFVLLFGDRLLENLVRNAD